jgi:hypothetical protein
MLSVGSLTNLDGSFRYKLHFSAIFRGKAQQRVTSGFRGTPIFRPTNVRTPSVGENSSDFAENKPTAWVETFPHKGINGISSILILSHNIEFHLWWLYPDEISNIVQSLWIQTLSRYFLTPKSSPKNFLLGSIGNGLP